MNLTSTGVRVPRLRAELREPRQDERALRLRPQGLQLRQVRGGLRRTGQVQTTQGNEMTKEAILISCPQNFGIA